MIEDGGRSLVLGNDRSVLSFGEGCGKDVEGALCPSCLDGLTQIDSLCDRHWQKKETCRSTSSSSQPPQGRNGHTTETRRASNILPNKRDSHPPKH